jgi:hypothetical protein
LASSHRLGGVDAEDHDVGPALALEPEHGLERDLLLGAARHERVGARDVDQVDRAAPGQLDPADPALDGDARVVADLGPAAGQRVEQGGLAAVRVAGDRDERSLAEARRRRAGVMARGLAHPTTSTSAAS